MAQLHPSLRPPNALSNAPTGTAYNALGCFPIGTNPSPERISTSTHALSSLRKSNTLQPISPSQYADLKASLAPLHKAQVFWARHERDAAQAHAVGELLSSLDGSEGAQELDIYTFDESMITTVSDDATSTPTPPIWGLFERVTTPPNAKTIIYLSATTPPSDLPGALLHTFLSSRGLSRLQCFLAEYVLADAAGQLTGTWGLPARLQRDVERLRREELRVLRERLDGEGRIEAPVLLAKLAGLCEELEEGGNDGVV